MIKGGFQGLDISGVDLTAQSPTLPGGYAACAAADGKPIRVLTADGAVQCSVKKVSANYVLAGVTGDGKILSITVGSTDGITVSETVPGGGIDVFLDEAVDIGTATYVNPYITQYDGLVKLNKTSSAEFGLATTINAKTGSGLAGSQSVVRIAPNAGQNTRDTCFVKKGTHLYCGDMNTGITAYFIPYKPVQS